MVGYAGAGNRVEAWIKPTAAGAGEDNFVPRDALEPIPATNTVEKTRVTIARPILVITSLSLTFPSPSNYKRAAGLNEWPPSFTDSSYTILFYPQSRRGWHPISFIKRAEPRQNTLYSR